MDITEALWISALFVVQTYWIIRSLSRVEAAVDRLAEMMDDRPLSNQTKEHVHTDEKKGVQK